MGDEVGGASATDPFDDRSNGLVRFNGLVGAATQLSFAVQRVIEGVAAERRMSIAQLRLLFSLLRVSPSVSGLAQHLRLSLPSTSGLVARAAKRGLVQRERRGGITFVALTDEGRDAAEDLLRAIKRELTAAAQGLDAAERDTFTALAERLVAGTRPTA